MTSPLTQFTATTTTLAVDHERRTIRGTITAYNLATTDSRRLVVHPGALRPRLPLSKVKLLRDHDQRQPVGFMTELDAKGLEAAFSIPAGPDGDLALEQAANGLRDGLSVGFQVLTEEGASSYDDKTRTFNVYAAELVEVSLCAIPAYARAGVTSVAASHQAPTDPPPAPTLTAPPTKESPTMTETLTREELDATLSGATADLTREVDARLASFAAAASAPVASGPSWPTFGAFVKDLVAGDTLAATFYEELAYTGPTATESAAGPNAWVADAIHLIDQRRPVLNTFTREPLPDKGMTLEYLALKSNTLVVAKQATLGANLTAGKVVLEAKNAPVETYGGYTELAKQIIDRANAAYVTTAFRAMDLEYAKATESAVRALLNAAITAQKAADNKVTLAATATAYDWLDLIVDATELMDARSYALVGSYVSKDVFKRLLRLEDSAGHALMNVQGQGVNQVGELDLTSLEGSLAKVKFKLLPGAAANTATFYDPLAVTTWESPGAPFQMQDETALNLTGGFSKYGYLAAASQHPEALLPIEFAAAG